MGRSGLSRNKWFPSECDCPLPQCGGGGSFWEDGRGGSHLQQHELCECTADRPYHAGLLPAADTPASFPDWRARGRSCRERAVCNRACGADGGKGSIRRGALCLSTGSGRCSKTPSAAWQRAAYVRDGGDVLPVARHRRPHQHALWPPRRRCYRAGEKKCMRDWRGLDFVLAQTDGRVRKALIILASSSVWSHAGWNHGKGKEVPK